MADGEFKTTIIRKLTGFRRIEDICETLTTETTELKKNQSEMKNAINEIGNMLDTMNSRLEKAGD